MSDREVNFLAASIGTGGIGSHFVRGNTFLSNALNLMGNASTEGSWTPRLEEGLIARTIPYTHCYDVIIVGDRTIKAVPLHETTVGLIGVQTCSPLIPGTRVWVMVLNQEEGTQHQSGIGVILGTMPTVPDTIEYPTQRVPGGLFGFFGDQAHRRHYTEGRITSIPYGNGRMGDILCGEWAKVGSLGNWVAVEAFCTSLGIDPMCGVFAYYFNNMLRLAGSVMKQETVASEKWLGLNEREVLGTDHVALFPWEGLGASKYSIDPFLSKSDTELGQTDLPIEPVHGGLQRPIWRDMSFRGYLGDIHQSYVAMPYGEFPEGVNVAGENISNFLGLFHQIVSSTGAYSLTSAKEINLRKKLYIPLPVENEDPFNYHEGDCEENYSPSGIKEDGSPDDFHYKFRFQWDKTDSESETVPAVAQISGLVDYHAWMFHNYYTKSLTNHAKDYLLQTTEEHPLYDFIKVPYRPTVTTQTWLDTPASQRLEVDHRTIDTDSEQGRVRYYNTESYVSLLPDGGIAIGDGYGSELILSGGNITISCPGDIFFRPGRSLISMAPRDTILKSGHAVDITAANGDVRVKAERNMMCLANQGGLLLESRGADSQPDPTKVGETATLSGVMLKATNSTAHVYGKSVYAKATDPGSGITLDSNGNDILFLHRSLRMLGADVQMGLGVGTIDEDVNIDQAKVTRITSSGLLMDGNIVASGSLLADGQGYFGQGLWVDGSSAIQGSLSATGSLAHGVQGPPGFLDREAKQDIRDQLRTQEKSLEENIESLEAIKENSLQQSAERALGVTSGVYGPGNSTYYTGFGFSYRLPAEYLTDPETNKFKLWATRWQKNASDDAAVWSEEPVPGPNPDSDVQGLSYPGYETWEKGDVFFGTNDPVNVDPTTGLPKSPDDMTSEGEDGRNPKKLKDSYVVSYQG